MFEEAASWEGIVGVVMVPVFSLLLLFSKFLFFFIFDVANDGEFNNFGANDTSSEILFPLLVDFCDDMWFMYCTQQVDIEKKGLRFSSNRLD